MTPRLVSVILLAVFVFLVVLGNTEDTDDKTVHASTAANNYKPVFLMHGFNETSKDMTKIADWIEDNHPGTITHVIPLHEGIPGSLSGLWGQIDDIWEFIRSTAEGNDAYDNGYHLLCHSQGGLIGRGIAQTKADHNIDQLITMASPHMGVYGFSEAFQGILPKVAVPTLYLPLTTGPLRFLSVAQYWRDPQHEPRFEHANVFLPVLNNLADADKDNSSPISPSEYKDNLLRLNNLVAFGSPVDKVVIPWQTELFGYADESGEAQSYTEREEYTGDTFGLKSLDDDGRLVRVQVPNVAHTDWITKREVFEDNVLDYLN